MGASRRLAKETQQAPASAARTAPADKHVENAVEFERLLLERLVAAVPDADVEAFSIVYWLLTVAHRIRSDLEVAVHRPLSSSRAVFSVLVRLHVLGPLTQNELAQLIDVTPANMSEMLGRLERLELIGRVRSVKDRRVVNVSLLDKGREQLEAELRAHDQRSSQWLDQVGARDRAQLLRLLPRLMKANAPTGEENTEIGARSLSDRGTSQLRVKQGGRNDEQVPA
jgi:DNA-binding MarR family transcriptional regulator